MSESSIGELEKRISEILPDTTIIDHTSLSFYQVRQDERRKTLLTVLGWIGEVKQEMWIALLNDRKYGDYHNLIKTLNKWMPRKKESS